MKIREILFRGKRKDNKEWVYGNYVYDKRYNRHYIYTGEYTDSGHFQEPNYLTRYEVIPETVGQYTGLTDKNGTKIFEGDIVKTHSDLYGVVVYENSFDDEFECDVCGWFWKGKDESGSAYNLSLSDMWDGHTVIGNLHDNPELMKGGNEF